MINKEAPSRIVKFISLKVHGLVIVLWRKVRVDGHIVNVHLNILKNLKPFRLHVIIKSSRQTTCKYIKKWCNEAFIETVKSITLELVDLMKRTEIYRIYYYYSFLYWASSRETKHMLAKHYITYYISDEFWMGNTPSTAIQNKQLKSPLFKRFLCLKKNPTWNNVKIGWMMLSWKTAFQWKEIIDFYYSVSYRVTGTHETVGQQTSFIQG